MAPPSRPTLPNSPSKISPEESKGFSYLRRLLLEPEQTELERLKGRLEDFTLQADDVSRVLPDAIRLRAQQDSRLLTSMIPITQEALSLSIKQSPQLISDSIAPILGPAIRKAIARAMRGMVQSLNQTLEYSMSWKGLQWRWEAFRTGKSFAEVVMLHTLRFRVEQVFLIHKKTGLLLNHVFAEGISGQGEEVISGMLTAIQDFVRDSFGQKQDDGLESLRIGDLTVWIEQGSGAILAGVIRGTPPMELREIFQESLETIHAQFSESFLGFEGDSTAFSDTRLSLEDCLQAQFEKKSKGLPFVFWILLGLLFLGLGIWAVQARSDQQRWAQLLEQVSQEPGLVVTSVQEEGAQSIFYGLRDPLAMNPEQILSEFGYTSEQALFRLNPFMDLTPDFIHKRAMMQLRPPSSVAVNLDGTELILSGEASHVWIKETRLVGPFISGVTHLEMGQLVDTDLRQFETLKAQLERETIGFDVGKFSLSSEQASDLSHIGEIIKALDRIAEILDIVPHLKIQGFSSPDGGKNLNEILSLLRAQEVADVLTDDSIRVIKFHAEGMGPVVTEKSLSPVVIGASPGRQVGFQVVVTQDHVSKSHQ